MAVFNDISHIFIHCRLTIEIQTDYIEMSIDNES